MKDRSVGEAGLYTKKDQLLGKVQGNSKFGVGSIDYCGIIVGNQYEENNGVAIDTGIDRDSNGIVGETLDTTNVTGSLGYKTKKNANGVKTISTNYDIDSLTYGENKKSGWFYDIQKQNPLTSVKLFTNAYYNVYTQSWEYSSNSKTKEEGIYNIWLSTCDSILSEDFQVQVINNFSDVGTDIVGGGITDFIKEIAPYRQFVTKGLKKAKQNKDKAMKNADFKKKVEDSKVASKLSEFVDKTSEIKQKIEDRGIDIGSFLNSRMVTQGAQFTYYGGTSIDFGNLSMKFTIFPKYYFGSFISVTEQLNELYPYFMGRLVDFKDSGILSNTKTFNKSILGQVLTSEELNDLFKVQKAPLGYMSTNRNIDLGMDFKGQDGTFELRIGSYYKISNLILKNVALSFSKYMTKAPGKDCNNTLSPLYCDVILSFSPSTKYSNESLMNFVNSNNSTITNYYMNKDLKKLNTDITSNYTDNSLTGTKTD